MTLLKLEYLYLNLDRIDALSLENPGKPLIWGAGLTRATGEDFRLEGDEGQAFEYVIRQIAANPHIQLPLVIDCMKVWSEKLPIGRVVENSTITLPVVDIEGKNLTPQQFPKAALTIPRINSSKIRDAIRKRGSMPPDVLPGEK